MRKIDPTTLYGPDELKDFLLGVVKIDTLRRFGLVGSPGRGYWGQNVVDSLNKYWDHLVRRRETGKVIGKENHLDEQPEFFEKRQEQVPDGEIHAPSGTSRKVESQRERFRRQLSENSFPRSEFE